MKRFVKSLLIYLSPILFGAAVFELLLREIPNDYRLKNGILENNANDFEVLSLGNSTTFYGINPKLTNRKWFNASHVSQTIRCDYEILNKFKGGLKNLKVLTLNVDYYTLYKSEQEIEFWRLKNYNIYYGMNLSYNPLEYFEIFGNRVQKNIDRLEYYYSGVYNTLWSDSSGYGYEERRQQNVETAGLHFAKLHSKNKKNYPFFDQNVEYLQRIINISKELDATIILYNSPAYSSYYNNLDANQIAKLKRVVNKLSIDNGNCIYINMFNDTSFVADDFRDGVHLNQKGAKKLTSNIEKIVADIYANQEP